MSAAALNQPVLRHLCSSSKYAIPLRDMGFACLVSLGLLDCILNQQSCCSLFHHLACLPAVPLDAGPGAAFFLIELLLGQNTNITVKTTSDCTLWVVPAASLLALAARRPDFVLELGLKMSQQMAGKVEQMEATVQSEERRNRALQPYRVTTPRRGVVGNSKYADRLRRQVGARSKGVVVQAAGQL